VAIHTTPPSPNDVLFDGPPSVQAGDALAGGRRRPVGSNAGRSRPLSGPNTDATVASPVRQTAASLVDKHNDLRLACAGGYAIASALRSGRRLPVRERLPRAQVKIHRRGATFRSSPTPASYFPKEESFFSHNEAQFKRCSWARLNRAGSRQHFRPSSKRPSPEGGDRRSGSGGLPRLWAARHRWPALTATFPPLPLERETDPRSRSSSAARPIHRDDPRHADFPWRVLGIAEHDRDSTATRSSTFWRAVADRRHLVDPAGPRSPGTGGTRSTCAAWTLQTGRQHGDVSRRTSTSPHSTACPTSFSTRVGTRPATSCR